MTKSHQGRVAVITGAAGGLGYHFALRLAHEGCKLALADIDYPERTVEALKAQGAEVYAEAFDLADAGQVMAFSRNVLECFGRCDILVNNAAHMPLIPFDELDLDALRRFEAVNVEASFLLVKGFADDMASRQYGRIIQIASSTTGSPMPGFAGYVTTKMAGIGLVRALAAELGPKGITVNAISPGLTRTESSAKHLPAELFEAVKQRQLIKRTEVPEDLCGALAFLTSEDAGFISGQVLNVDGGATF